LALHRSKHLALLKPQKANGGSHRVSSSVDAQFQVQSAVLNELVVYARNYTKDSRVVLFGHSYGSYISSLSASQIDIDAIVLTGFTGSFDHFAPFVAGAGFRVAKLQDPKRWSDLDSGYLTSVDLFAETYVYFKEPYFDRSIAEWSYNAASEPFAFGELLSILNTEINYSNIEAPVFLLQGRYDVSACGGDCVGLMENAAALFKGSKSVKFIDNIQAG